MRGSGYFLSCYNKPVTRLPGSVSCTWVRFQKALDYWNILPGQGHYYNPDFIKTGYDTSRITGYVTDIITDFSIDWINKRDTSKPFFLVIGQKATHREWLPALEDLGAYDSVNFPMPPTFYDDYKGRHGSSKSRT